jgi:hypothetical protein
VLRRWPELPQTVRSFIIRLVTECPAPDDPTGQQQDRIQAALDLAREIAGMLASETPKAKQPV